MMNSSNFLLLRTPLQSLSSAFDDPNLEKNNEFCSAIQLAAPDFYRELEKIASANDKDRKKLQESLYKYWLRSCTRCTPYGIFAGSSIVYLHDISTSITLSEKKEHILKSRLDMSYLFSLKAEIEGIPEVQRQLKFVANNSLYETPLGFRYAEFHLKGDVKHYKLSSVEKSEYISFILKSVRVPKSLKELNTGFITQFPSLNEEKAYNFLMEMYNSQLLINNLELNLTGADPLQGLIASLSTFENVETIVDKLQSINTMLNQKNRIEHYNTIKTKLPTIFPLNNFPKDKVQIDLALSTRANTISKLVIDEITKQTENLFTLSRVVKNTNLENFKNRFSERFEHEEIPMNFALDNDLGIGYGENESSNAIGSHLINDLPIISPNSQTTITQDYITDYTFSKYQEFINENQVEIEIQDEELKNLKNKRKHHKFPSSLYIFGSLLSKNNELTTNNFSFHINSIAGPSAANIIGRFTMGNDELTRLTRITLEHEEAEYPDYIFAEIVHNPQARIGNILLRSHLRKYEIPYIGKSGLDEENQIPVSDIMISVNSGEIILRSIKHNKRIFPRLSTAHNFSTSSNLPIYKFLCDIQSQDLAYPNVWDWGALEALKYLPRVSYKNLIIKKARWVIDKHEIFQSNKNEIDPDRFKELIKKNNIPKLVVMVQGDNQLLIDLENPKAISLLFNNIKKYNSVTIEEFLFNSDNCIVKDEANLPYTNEMIIPINRKFEQPINTDHWHTFQKSLQRKFPPNSEWLYLKIYGGETTLDKILDNKLYPLIENSIQKKQFEKFFFIRYNDKLGPHLRLRFFNSDIQQQYALQIELMEILAPLLKSKLINNLTIDTYVREVERYSEELIIECESIFYHDSMTVMKLNNLLTQVEEPDKYRLLFAIRGIDIFFSDFNLDLKDKLVITKSLSEGYFNEFGASQELKQSLNNKYRKLQKDIFSHMNELQDQENEIEEGIAIFINRSLLYRSTIEAIISKKSTNKNFLFKQVLTSIIHMFNNKLFKSHQRKHELVIYTFLEKYYISQKAINNKK